MPATAINPGPVPTDTTQNKSIIKFKPGIPSFPGRPKAPSRQHIQCEVEDGVMTILFAIPEGMCLLKLTDTASGKTLEEVFNTSEEHSFYVGNLIEGYIKLSTSDGNIYGASYW